MTHLKFKMDKRRITAFALGFLVVLYVQLIHSLGIRPPYQAIKGILSPVSQKQPNNKEDLMKKLEGKGKNTLKLNSSRSIISQADASEETIQARSYIVADSSSGEILASLNPDKKVPIASLTKIMTAVVVSDIAEPDELFTVTDEAASKVPTKIGVIPGQKLTVKELLNATLLTSANDAAQVIKDGVDAKYGEGTFVWAMNQKAQYLGLSNTHFANPQGFDSKDNYSSAADLAVLSTYALKNYPLISEIAKKDYEFIPANEYHKQFDLYNWNGLIGVYPGANGLKIGNTEAAGKTTVVTSVRSGKELIAVVLGSTGILERDLNASKLLDIGFSKELGLAYANVTEEKLKEKYKTWKYWN